MARDVAWLGSKNAWMLEKKRSLCTSNPLSAKSGWSILRQQIFLCTSNQLCPEKATWRILPLKLYVWRDLHTKLFNRAVGWDPNHPGACHWRKLGVEVARLGWSRGRLGWHSFHHPGFHPRHRLSILKTRMVTLPTKKMLKTFENTGSIPVTRMGRGRPGWSS